MSNVIIQLNNKVSEKFDQVIATFNHKHTQVTHMVEPVWIVRMGQFDGNTPKEGEEQKPFVVVEIYHKEVQVYRSFHVFESKPNSKQVKAGSEALWNSFQEHAQSMVMLKFLHYYDSQITEEAEEIAPPKLDLITP